MSRLNVYTMKLILVVLIAAFLLAGCSGNNDNEHTTATTIVPPPPTQVLRAEIRPIPYPRLIRPDYRIPGKTYDPQKPVLLFDLKNEFREGEPVVIECTLFNANEPDYRVRYMIDDGDMQWMSCSDQVALWGWVPGKHTLRIELVGPDGRPYRNGDLNIETREITIIK